MRFIKFFAFLICLSACSKENKKYTTRFTLVNAVPNSTSFSFEAGNVVVDPGISFGDPRYEISAPAATTTLRWVHNGSPSVDSSFLTDLPNGVDFQLIFYDSIGRLMVYLKKDVWQQAASKSKAYIRLMPLIIDADNLYITNDTNRIIVPARGFGSFPEPGSDFTAVDTTTTKLKLFNGIDLLDSISSPNLTPGGSYTIYTFGVIGATGDKKPKMKMHLHQ